MPASMRTYAVLVLAASALLAPLAPAAAAPAPGSLIKGSSSSVYYVWEGKRWVFPNEAVYFSWYRDFGSVATVADTDLSALPLGGNITFRPGSKLVKLQSEPKTYAVAPGGVLRWVTSEEAAAALYGPAWAGEVRDLSDAFFLDYRVGEPVSAPEDLDLSAAASLSGIFEDIAARTVPPSARAAALPTEARAAVSGAWSDPATWGGRVPGPGAEVRIPIGIEVVYDASSSGELRSLDIDGRLVFAHERTTSLSARMIRVGGALVIGTADEPLPAGTTAELRLSAASTFGISDDGLRVHGVLEMHGAEPRVAWTRLAAPARSGDVSIELEEAPDWKPGDEIVIASGSHEPLEAETRVLASVDGKVVAFDEPLLHDHRADEVFASEVGLLTRNARVLGAGAGQGSHVTVSGRGEARIAGAEFRGLGRTGVPGQYALFFDGLGRADGSYLRNSSVVGSGNRCAVFRQTRDMAVSRLVAHEIGGHCLSMADGAETSLSWTDNLVAAVRGGSAATGDMFPVAFHVRHPSAILTGNAAAGSSGHGFWYDLPATALRSDGALERPREAALGAFAGNRAHSNAGDGLRIDGLSEEQDYSPPRTAVFSGYAAALNGGYGFWMRGSGLEVSGAFLAGNRVGGSFAAFGAALRDSLVVGDIGAGAGGVSRYGFTFQDGPVSVSGTTFRSFASSDGASSAAFSFHAPNPRVPDPRNGYRDIVFEDAAPWHVPAPSEAGDYLSVARDIDAGLSVVSADPFLDRSCRRAEGSAHMVCDGRYATLLAVFRGASGVQPARFIRADSGAAFTLHVGPAFDGRYAYLPAIEGGEYRVSGPGTRDLSFSWHGQHDPVAIRVQAPASASVRLNGEGSHDYDAATGEIVLRLAPGASADLVW